MSKDPDKMNSLITKFVDIKAIREKIIVEAGEIGAVLKKDLAQKKAASPEVMNKNLKSLSSFLENFSRMIQNLSSKITGLTSEIEIVKGNLDKTSAGLLSMKK